MALLEQPERRPDLKEDSSSPRRMEKRATLLEQKEAADVALKRLGLGDPKLVQHIRAYINALEASIRMLSS